MRAVRLGTGSPPSNPTRRGPAYHTQPTDVGRVARDARAKKLVITHLMPGSVPAELAAAAGKDFAGPVAVGEDLAEV